MTKYLAGSVARDISGQGENNYSGVGGSPDRLIGFVSCGASLTGRVFMIHMQGLFGLV